MRFWRGNISEGDLITNLDTATTKTIVTLVYPVIIENILQTLVLFFNMAMLGHLGTPFLAAAGLVNSVMFAIIHTFMGLQIGVTSLVARFVGAKDYEKAKEVSLLAFAFSFLIGLILTILLLPFGKRIMEMMGAEKEVAYYGAEYFHFLILSLAFRFILLVSNGILRGYGDTKTPMFISLIMQVLTILLSYLLIFGIGFFPKEGIAGAGQGVAIGAIIASLFALGALKAKINYRWTDFSLLKKLFNNLLLRLLKVSMPAACEQLLLNIGFLAFIRIVASLGTTALAAHQIAVRIESISFMPGGAFGIVAMTLVGQSLGAKRKELAIHSIKKTLLLSLAIMSALGLLFFFFPHYLVLLFSPKGAVKDYSANLIRIGAFEQPALALSFVFAGSLRGAGDTLSPMIVALLSTFFMRVGLVYLLAIILKMGIYGVWYGTVIDWTVRAIILYFLYRLGRWQRINEN